MDQLPDDPRLVLQDQRYYTEEALAAVDDRVETVDCPAEALDWADAEVELAGRLGVLWQARARSRRGWALMRAGQHEDAECEYNSALGLLGDHHPADRGDLLRRMAILRLAQERVSEALLLADQAVKLARGHGTAQQLGLAVMERGVVLGMCDRYDDAADHFSESLRYLSHGQSEEIYYAAIHNLAAAMVKSPDPCRLSNVFAMLKVARSALPPGATEARVRLKWIEGLAYLRLGSNMRATGILRRACRKLDGTAQERATLALDLSQAYYMEGSHARAAGALAEALGLYQTIEGVNPVAMEAVAQCLHRMRRHLPDSDPWSVRETIAAGRVPARAIVASLPPENPLDPYWDGTDSPW